jgi:predicted nucleic acid-binding protein
VVTASLDTSFWTIGYHAEVLPYLFDYFDISVTPDVEDEITSRDHRFPTVVYGYSKLYEVFKADGRFRIVAPTQRIGQFGKGEDTAISLALENHLTIFINDVRPLNFARAAGLSTVSVPTFIVALCADGVIHKNAALAKLNAIQYNTSPALLSQARDAIVAL